ncbi:MAG: HEAT repeat domain-containing protein [Candidatus Omnitrophica bacterium]|nr:HEAT repeat domain-containing protein [Candidatus Omnitrophota bacterium]
MDPQLNALEQKQRKLIFIFGEKLFELSRARDVRFRYTFEGEDQRAEIEKLLTLMNYLEDRIESLGDPADQSVPADADEESDEVADAQGAAEAESSDDDEELLVSDASEEDDYDGDDSGAEEAVAPAGVPAPVPVVEPLMVTEPEVVIAVPQPVPVAAPVSQEPLPPAPVVPAEEVIVKVDEYEEDQVNRVVAEEVALELPGVAEKSGSWDGLEEVLRTADFTSEADRRIFENNLKQLRSGDEREREVSIGQISHISSRKALRQAFECLLRDPAVRIRLAVIKSVSRMKDVEMEGFFELGLSDADDKVRIAALKGLGTQVSDKNRAILERLLKDADEHIRGLAVTYLGIYYGKEGVARAVSMKADPSPYVRISIIELVSIVKPDGALTVVKDLLSDAHDDVKKAAEKALAKVMPERKKKVVSAAKQR